MSIDVPADAFGRAIVAAWQKEHAGHADLGSQHGQHGHGTQG